jgi:serine/threonine-protein kinase
MRLQSSRAQWLVTTSALLAGLGSSSCRGDRQGTAHVDMVGVPAATFRMGCDPARDPSCADTERPAHSVTVQAFRIDRTEVTRGAYAACVAAGACTAAAPSSGENDARPASDVSWAQARAFCRWAGRRLPSEAEWELAARGTDGRVYPWGDEVPTCERAHTTSCGPEPAAVGGRPLGASPYGALDMAGNVDEWVEDAYAPYDDPARTSEQRIARGGAYDHWHSRSTERNALAPSYHDALLGFRCAAGE